MLLFYTDGGMQKTGGGWAFEIYSTRTNHVTREEEPDKLLVSKAGATPLPATTNTSEYMALLCALQYARALGMRRVHVLSDSKLMIDQLEGAARINVPHLRVLAERCRDLLTQMQVSITHIRGQYNKADKMAKWAAHSQQPFYKIYDLTMLRQEVDYANADGS